MKLFKQLLVAPAALGLLAPVAANADQLNISSDLEAGIASEEGHFSATTKLNGTTKFVVGGADEAPEGDAIHFLYDTILNLDTSFNGRDLLRTSLRSGNFNEDSPFDAGNSATLETAFGDAATSGGVVVNRNFYRFPISDSDFTATIGAVVRQDDMLNVWPSDYPVDTVLDVMTYAGAPDVYNLKLGAGAGISYDNGNGWSGSLVYVGSESDEGGHYDSTSGLMTDEGADDITGQVAYVGEQWGAALAFTNSDSASDDYDAWSLSAYWVPAESGIWPSVSGGLGFTDPEDGDLDDENTWTLGVQWTDVFVDGNTLGLGIGTATNWDEDSDGPLAYEAWYQISVSDNITVTPAVFVVEREDDDDITGAIVKTTFKF